MHDALAPSVNRRPMHCLQFHLLPRRIATGIVQLVALSCFVSDAQTPGIRLSAPSLGWILAANGSQLVEITGLSMSPRTGRSLPLPSPGRRLWVAPDSSSAVVRLDTGLFLLRSDSSLQALQDLTADVETVALWDRSSAGFALCWQSACESREANGAIRSRWDLPAGHRPLAFSLEHGLVAANSDSALWLRLSDSTPLDAVPAAAAFRPHTIELWLLDSSGRLSGRDFQGRRTGEAQLVPNALGLVASQDGAAFFAANAAGAAAVASLATSQTEQFAVEDSVEGVWAAPGLFAIRLHASAKRPIGFWNGETGLTGWMPAHSLAESPETEVRQ